MLTFDGVEQSRRSVVGQAAAFFEQFPARLEGFVPHIIQSLTASASLPAKVLTSFPARLRGE